MREAKTDGAKLLAHTGFVRAMARGVLGGDSLVEDAVQETWLAALTSGPDRPGRLRSWLGSVSRRRALEHRRRSAVRGEREAVAVRTGVAPSTAELAERAEIGRKLVDALLSLKDPSREALLLRYYEDLPPREMASRLGVPVETARTRVKRGLARLRERLDEEYDGDARRWASVLLLWDRPEGSAPGKARPAVLAFALTALVLLAVGSAVFGLLVSNNDRAGPPPVGEESQDDASAAATPDGPGEPAAPAAEETEVAAKSPGLRGTVVDGGGKTVAHLPVHFTLEPAEPGRDPIEGELLTDAEGRYEVADLPPGKLEITLHSERPDGPPYERVRTFEGSLTEDFRLPGRLSFSGRVVTAGESAVTIWLVHRDEFHGGHSTGAGVRGVRLGAARRFRFTGLRAGVYQLMASGEGVETRSDRVEVLADTADHTVELHAAFILTGRVAPPPGLPVEIMHLYIESMTRGFTHMVSEMDEGAFRVEKLLPDRYRFFFRHMADSEEETVMTEREFEVEVAGPGAPLSFALTRDETVGLFVRVPDGASVTGRVSVEGSPAGDDNHVEFKARTEGKTIRMGLVHLPLPGIGGPERTPDGGLLLTGMPEGQYTIVVEVPGYAVARRRVEVKGPETFEVTLVRQTGRDVTIEEVSDYAHVEMRDIDPAAAWKTLFHWDKRTRISHDDPPVTTTFVPTGTYLFRVRTAAFAPATSGPITIEAGGDPLPIAFDLEEGLTIRGRLLERPGGDAFEGMLHVFRLDAETPVAAPEKNQAVWEGDFTIRGLTPGRYRLSLSRTGHPALADVELKDADRTLALTATD